MPLNAVILYVFFVRKSTILEGEGVVMKESFKYFIQLFLLYFHVSLLIYERLAELMFI